MSGPAAAAGGMLGEAREEVVHGWSEPVRERMAVPIPPHLHPDVIATLTRSGIDSLHAFQARAIDAVLAGQDVVLAGGVGAGKSLCYQVPLLDALRRDRTATALYLSPTKALAQDQARRLRALGARWARPMLYDGDTPQPTRAVIRRSANLVLTNPDMLSAGILPRHADFARLLAGLRLVVIDEAHVYRGVFGSHVAMVLRRLLRLCAHYGAAPVVVASSGTIANAAAHVAALTARSVEEIDDEGAPSAGRDIVVWNPALDEDADRRTSPLTDASALLADLLTRGVSTICFARTRNQCELVYRFCCERLAADGQQDVARLVTPYRGGYAPEERREIERQLAAGELLGVVATSALELGIDIGTLEAAMCVTFPGSISSLAQQFGRAGRGTERGLGVLVCGHDALDQYLAREPGVLEHGRAEHAVISVANPRIVTPHVAAAACELGISDADRELFDPATLDAALAELDAAGVLRTTGDGIHYVGRDHPAGGLSLRSVDGGKVTIIERATGAAIGTVELFRALTSTYPGAVYLHRGRSYLVDALDLSRRVATVSAFADPWYTLADTATAVTVLDVIAARDVGSVRVHFGRVQVTEQVTGYQRTSSHTHRPIDTVDQHMPPVRFATEAVWYAPPHHVVGSLGAKRLLGSIHAAEHAAIGMLPLVATCDRADIGGLSIDWHEHLAAPTVFVYDGHPGGVGICQAGYERFAEWIDATIGAIEACPCGAPNGCPSCVQSPKCGNLNDPLDKQGALAVLRALGTGRGA